MIDQLDEALAETLADLPHGWHLHFVAESEGTWQAVAFRESNGQAQEGRAPTLGGAFRALFRRIADDVPTVDREDVNTHPTVRVTVGDREADIDEAMAPLVEGLWKLGIETQSSCQGSPGRRGHLTFPDPGYAAQFLNVVGAEFDPTVDSLWNRAARVEEPDDWTVHRRDRIWEYSADAFDDSAFETDGVYKRIGDVADFVFTLTVGIPHDDLPRIAECLRQAAERRERPAGSDSERHP